MKKSWLHVLSTDRTNLNNFDYDVFLSDKQTGGEYYTIVSKRYDVENNVYNILETTHFVNGLTLAYLKEQKYGIALINWFKNNTKIV